MSLSFHPDNLTHFYKDCTLCPRNCHADRTVHPGFCGCGPKIRAARAALHFWEEPCISGTGGSGTIFFSGCTLRCCFCQNYPISSKLFGKEISVNHLADIFLSLQDQGAENISLVTATQYLPSILPALDLVKDSLRIPVVYNCGGYEKTETLKLLDGYIDIYLPDLKYFDNQLSARYSGAGNYFQYASAAVSEMIRQTGAPSFDDRNVMQKGVIIRHMVLPGMRHDSVRILQWMHDHLKKGSFLLSLMSQYTPFYKAGEYPEINRRITTYEYRKVLDTAIALGLTEGYMQKKSSAKEEYTPPFDLEGL